MKLLLLTGNHRRHLFFAYTIIETGMVEAMVLETREEFIPTPPVDIEEIDKSNFIRHFDDRRKAEELYFPNKFRESSISLPIHEVSYESLNTVETARFVRVHKPDLALVFGIGLIKEPLLSALPPLTINLHLGLSPWYKGSATLFWPFYFLEPQFAGSTFHLVVPQIDAGHIIAHCVPTLNHGDGIHDVGAKVVMASAKEALRIIEYLSINGNLPLLKQTKTGKLFLTTDFIPAHLRIIYQAFNNKIVDYYLEGKLSTRQPKLVTF